MKKIILTITILATASLFSTAFRQPAEGKALEIGESLPQADLKMKNALNDKEITLASAKGSKGLLVMFSCNTCPFVVASEKRIKESAEQAAKAGFGVVIVNSNEAKRGDDDSPASMKKYGKKQGFKCAYAVDANSTLADAFGANRTPECYLFDKDNKLVYHGGIDDSPKDEKAVTAHYLSDAIKAVEKGEEVAVKTSRSIGCTIKRISK